MAWPPGRRSTRAISASIRSRAPRRVRARRGRRRCRTRPSARATPRRPPPRRKTSGRSARRATGESRRRPGSARGRPRPRPPGAARPSGRPSAAKVEDTPPGQRSAEGDNLRHALGLIPLLPQPPLAQSAKSRASACAPSGDRRNSPNAPRAPHQACSGYCELGHGRGERAHCMSGLLAEIQQQSASSSRSPKGCGRRNPALCWQVARGRGPRTRALRLRVPTAHEACLRRLGTRCRHPFCMNLTGAGRVAASAALSRDFNRRR